MQSLVVATPAPFRRYIIEKGTKRRSTVVLERAKKFKVDYDIWYRNNEINHFYKEKFGSDDSDWKTYHVENVNDHSLIEIARNICNLDSIILTGSNFVRNKTLSQLRLLTDKIVNIHFGDACLYRGLDSNWWALLNMPHTSPAVTLHVVDPGIDTGPILKKIHSPKMFSEVSLGELLYFEVQAANRLFQEFLYGGAGYENLSGTHNNKGDYKSAMSSANKKQAVANLRCIDL